MVWKTCHYSSMSMRERRAPGVELGVHINHPSGVRGTHRIPPRALPTSLRPGGMATADPGQFTAVYYHMDYWTASWANADVLGRERKVCNSFNYFLLLCFSFCILYPCLKEIISIHWSSYSALLPEMAVTPIWLERSISPWGCSSQETTWQNQGTNQVQKHNFVVNDVSLMKCFYSL